MPIQVCAVDERQTALHAAACAFEQSTDTGLRVRALEVMATFPTEERAPVLAKLLSESDLQHGSTSHRRTGWEVGELVQAQYKDAVQKIFPFQTQSHFKAVITAKNDDGTYTVKWDHGSQHDNIKTAEQLKPREDESSNQKTQQALRLMVRSMVLDSRRYHETITNFYRPFRQQLLSTTYQTKKVDCHFQTGE